MDNIIMFLADTMFILLLIIANITIIGSAIVFIVLSYGVIKIHCDKKKDDWEL